VVHAPSTRLTASFRLCDRHQGGADDSMTKHSLNAQDLTSHYFAKRVSASITRLIAILLALSAEHLGIDRIRIMEPKRLRPKFLAVLSRLQQRSTTTVSADHTFCKARGALCLLTSEHFYRGA
jgi:hypothetical protein